MCSRNDCLSGKERERKKTVHQQRIIVEKGKREEVKNERMNEKRTEIRG